MGAKAIGCPINRNSNEPNARCGSFAGQPVKHSAPAREAAATDGLKAKK
jgi:hypothetical protein